MDSSVSLALSSGALLLPHTPNFVSPNSSTEEGANNLWTMAVRFSKPSFFLALPNHHRSVKPSITVPRRWLPPSNPKHTMMRNLTNLSRVSPFVLSPSHISYLLSDPTTFPTVPESSKTLGLVTIHLMVMKPLWTSSFRSVTVSLAFSPNIPSF